MCFGSGWPSKNKLLNHNSGWFVQTTQPRNNRLVARDNEVHAEQKIRPKKIVFVR